jgi:hypothetical protein
MTESDEILALKKAIRYANEWLLIGEGVGLTYYHSDYWGKDCSDSVQTINRVLNETPTS